MTGPKELTFAGVVPKDHISQELIYIFLFRGYMQGPSVVFDRTHTVTSRSKACQKEEVNCGTWCTSRPRACA
jgi:hypothetical protein